MIRPHRIAALTCATLTAGAGAWADPAPHPEPRVIVSVSSVRGPHPRADVERAARLAWGRIVSCYKASPKRPRGSVELELGLTGGGKVSSARRRKSTLGDTELASCLTRAMNGIAQVQIRVAPGDAVP
jgi:hypothetical protein